MKVLEYTHLYVADSHIQYANNIQQTYMHGDENTGYRVAQDGRLVKLSLTSLLMIGRLLYTQAYS